MINIKRLKSSTYDFYILFNLYPEDFNVLVKNVESHFYKNETEKKKRTNKKHQVITTGSGRKFKCPIEQRVAIYLIYRRSKISHKTLGKICEVDESRISQYFKKLKPIIELYSSLLGHGWSVPEKKVIEIINLYK